MALSLAQVNDICRPNWHRDNICKYLDQYSVPGKCVCTKLNKVAHDALAKRQGSYAGKADNCKGYLLLVHKTQGYDV